MFISQEFKRNNGYGFDNHIIHINPDKLTLFKKKCKKVQKQLKGRWEVYGTQCVDTKRRKVPNEIYIGQRNQQYSIVCVMVNDPKTGKGTTLRALLDSGGTKSIILKSLHW